MKKICEICEQKFETNSKSRLYCYECSGESTRMNNESRKHQKTILRRSMKKQAIKTLGGKCSVCGYDKCIDALEFHHKNPLEKDFKIGSGNTMSWKKPDPVNICRWRRQRGEPISLIPGICA